MTITIPEMTIGFVLGFGASTALWLVLMWYAARKNKTP